MQNFVNTFVGKQKLCLKEIVMTLFLRDCKIYNHFYLQKNISNIYL